MYATLVTKCHYRCTIFLGLFWEKSKYIKESCLVLYSEHLQFSREDKVSIDSIKIGISQYFGLKHFVRIVIQMLPICHKIKKKIHTSSFSSGIEHSFWEYPSWEQLVIEAGSGAIKAWGSEFEVIEDTETADCFRRPLIFLRNSCSFDVSSSYEISIDTILISSYYSCFLGRWCVAQWA